SGGRRPGLPEGDGADDRAVGSGSGGGGGGDGGGRAARDRAGAAVADRARLQLAGPERAASDPAAAGAGAAAGRRRDRGDGGDAGRGGGRAAAHGREGDPEQVCWNAGCGGRDAGSVAAAQGGVASQRIEGCFGCVGSFRKPASHIGTIRKRGPWSPLPRAELSEKWTSGASG